MIRVLDRLESFYGRLTARQILLWSLVIGIAVRVVVGVFYTYPVEDNYWILASTNFTAGEGLYGLPGYYYLPVWGYVMVLITAFVNALGIPYGTYLEDFGGAIKDCDVVIPSMGYSLAVMAALIVLDIMVGYLLHRVVMRITGDEKRSALAAAVWFLCPLTIAMSCIRLMFENLEIFLLLASILLLMDRRPVPAGLAMGACLLSKQFGIFAAILLIGYAYAQTRDLRYTAGYVLGTLVMGLVLMAPVLITGDLETSMHWLTSRAESGSSSSGFNLTLYLVPVLAAATLVMTYLVAKKGITDIPLISLMMVLPVAIMMMVSGNVQYYLFLLPFLILAMDRFTSIPYAMMSILAVFSLLCFISQCSIVYIDSGWPLSDLIASVADLLSPFEDMTGTYEHWKAYTGASVVLVVLFSLYRRVMPMRRGQGAVPG